ELAEINELRDLRFADDQLRAVLYLLVFVGESVRQRIARIIGPLDDVDELLLDEIQDRHRISLETNQRNRPSREPLRASSGLRRAGEFFRLDFGIGELLFDLRERQCAGNDCAVGKYQ